MLCRCELICAFIALNWVLMKIRKRAKGMGNPRPKCRGVGCPAARPDEQVAKCRKKAMNLALVA